MSTYSTSSIPQGIAIYANATLFPVTAQDGEQAVAADTNTLYIYDTSVPGWQAVANPGAAIAIDALTGEVTATGPGVVAATITNAAVTNAKLAAMADNTVKGNKSGAPASPSDLALSNVTEAVSSVLTISNGSKTVVSAADLTIEVKQSSAVQSGYLSSTDWSTFNNAATDVLNATASATPNTIAERDASADCAFNVLKIGAGTAAAPSLAYSSDLDTGLFFAGNNIVNLSTNGLERVRVDANGNVGINSSSPNARLQVNNSGTQLGLSVFSTSSNNTAELYNQGTTNYTLALNSAADSAFTGASIGGYFARGTLSSRAQTLANDSLLSISASGHTGSGVAGISGAIVIGADENTQANAYGGQIILATTPNSTPGGSPIPRMYVKNDGKVNIPDLTASQLLATDASKNLQSLSTATYPSLTEISYVKGVTSSIQTQLNGLQPAGNYITALTSDVTATGPGSVAATVAFVGGKTSSEVATSVTDTQNATALSTPSTLMERDGSGETALDGLSLDGSTSGAIKLQAAATTTNYTVKLPSAQGAASTFLQNDGSGNLSWAAPSSLPSQTGNQYKVLATDGSAASWQFAGLGDGSFPSNTIILGRNLPTGMTAANGILIGVGSNLGTGTDQVIIGYNSGRSTAGATGANNVVVGSGSFNSASLTSGNNNVIVGQNSAIALTTGSENVCIGYTASTTNTRVGVTTGSQSVFVGSRSGFANTPSGTASVAVGYAAGSETDAVAIGALAYAGQTSIAIGRSAYTGLNSASVAIGYGSLIRVGVGQNGGSQTTALGAYTGGGTLGGGFGLLTRCVYLGAYAGSYSGAKTDEFMLDNQDRGSYANTQTKSLLYGTFNATETSQTLRINAQTQLAYGEKHASLHGQVGTANVITAATSNYYIGVDCSLAAKTVNLPAAATAGQGFVLVVKDESGNAAANNITIDANGAELIDGALVQTINANYGSLNLMCSGTAWFII